MKRHYVTTTTRTAQLYHKIIGIIYCIVPCFVGCRLVCKAKLTIIKAGLPYEYQKRGEGKNKNKDDKSPPIYEKTSEQN